MKDGRRKIGLMWIMSDVFYFLSAGKEREGSHWMVMGDDDDDDDYSYILFPSVSLPLALA